MKSWLKISMLLCSFGFLRELRPSDSFATEFLSGEWHEITSEQVNKELYPLGIYMNLGWLVIILLVTDMLRYKPIIITSACAGIILWSILLWTESLWELQVGQFFYGLYMASEVAYYTYIYAKVDKDHYQKVTGNTRAAMLAGKFLAGVIAQVLLSAEVMNYRDLNFLSLGTQIISLFIGIGLPSVKKSIYFYTSSENLKQQSVQHHNSQQQQIQLESALTTNLPKDQQQQQQPTTAVQPQQTTTNGIELNTSGHKIIATNENEKPKFSWQNATRLLGMHVISAYSKPVVVEWSIWWALATCGQLQVVSYVQFLWKEIDDNHQSAYNGATDAIATLLGAVGALAAGFFNSHRYQRWNLWILTICSLFMGGLLLWAATTNFVWVAYVIHIVFYTVYFFVVTKASAIVAENIVEDSFGLIFGINTLVALGAQSIFTLIVITESGFSLQPRGQFLTFGGYFVVLSALYCLAGIVKYFKGNSQ
ncbi:thiamine transporter 1-like [Episyrphus balteatus]|uniref:thiamine transporter 1-like n=1 Tax=Episyrphus balteatus TaxID=286459 RepID=UPI0024861524|nr:thiamine transporter 1-like [Episyrphus balteatus]XP_055859381.1 thiamine transporter 1-like [Episyrphus balteatus]XP_055859382.1 thiamine transporter 1-like [Episyrphus balteatus]